MSHEPTEWIEVLASPHPAIIGAVKSAFALEGIEHVVKGELTLVMRGCVIPARVLVRPGDAARARELLRGATASMGH